MARTQLSLSSTQATTPDAKTGTLTARMQPQNVPLLVVRMSITGPTNSIMRMYVGPTGSDTNLGYYRATSYFGQLDDGDFPNGVLVPAGQQLYCCWFDISGAGGSSILNPLPLVATTLQAYATADVENTFS